MLYYKHGKKAVEFMFLSCINLSFLANNLFFGSLLAKTSTSDRLLEIRNFSFPQVTKVCSSFWIEAILVCDDNDTINSWNGMVSTLSCLYC